MTATEAVEKIMALREITAVTGCQTRRAQSELLASLPNEVLTEVAVKLKPILSEEKNRHGRYITADPTK